ncbi:MAG: DUF924 family protein [Povalibacter sp.]
MPIESQWQEEVIRFWFEEIKPELWFDRDPEVDATLRSRFSGVYEHVSEQASPASVHSAREALATVIVLDQFSRNLFRDSPRAFATDAKALAIAQHAISKGWDQELTKDQRIFLYMPFQHAEDHGIQQRSIELFTALGDPQTLDYALRHKAVIDRFGRYPHRNATLGRTSTPEETEYVRTNRGF